MLFYCNLSYNSFWSIVNRRIILYFKVDQFDWIEFICVVVFYFILIRVDLLTLIDILILLETIYFLLLLFFVSHIKIISMVDIIKFHNKWYSSSGVNELSLQMNTDESKWDIENFPDDNNFGLWRVNMQTVLTQQRCVEALKGETFMYADIT